MEEIINERYRIIRPAGSGGMSEVFLAHDELLDRDVALKRLRPQFSEDSQLLDQFSREARSAAGLVHPNIVGIYDVVEDKGNQYIVMEYVKGCTLKEWEENHSFETGEALLIIKQLAEALQVAHKRHIVHCDLKPQNILISEEKIPKIADFGIAKIISDQTLVVDRNMMGSVYYISPEQVHGLKLTAASDIYSLGIVLFEMLTGKVPFTGETPVAVAMMHAEKPVPPLSEFMDNVPEDLQKVLDKMLAKDQGARYANAGELVEDLDKILAKTNDISEETTVPPEEEGNKIIAVSVNKEAMARKAKNWREALELKIKNFHYTFNSCLVILTILVCLVSLLAHFLLKRENVRLTVPSVVNMQKEEAGKYLVQREFKVEFGEETSLGIPEGTVLRQIPPSGEKRRRGSTVKVIVSTGAEKHTMPELGDMTLVKAQQVLDEIGVKLGKIERKYDYRHRIGTIIQQAPKAGEKVGEGTAVDIVLCEGDIKMPNLVGQPLNVAESMLRRAGLRVGDVRRVSSQEPRNTVTATTPEAGIMLPSYYPVDVTVSSGLDKSVVGSVFEYWLGGSSQQTHRIQIYKVSSKGRSLIYSNNEEKGGKNIRLTLDTKGETVNVLVYCDNRLVYETTVQ